MVQHSILDNPKFSSDQADESRGNNKEGPPIIPIGAVKACNGTKTCIQPNEDKTGFAQEKKSRRKSYWVQEYLVEK